MLHGIDILRNFSVAVAGYVLYGYVSFRFFAETLYGHYREKLIYCPRIGKTLEEREIAEVFVCKQTVETAQFFGYMFLGVDYGVCLTGYAPVKTLDLSACFKVYDSVIKEFESFVAYLLCIVPVFEHGTSRKIVPNFGKVLYKFVVVCRGFEIVGHLRLRSHVGYLKNQNTMVSGE